MHVSTNEHVSTHDEPAAKARGASPVTLERAAYAAILLVAAGLRFYQLGMRPLGEGEAAQALAAYRFVRGAAQVAPEGTIPALFTANLAGFALVGASDTAARWLPALAGVLLILLPYWLRDRLGRGGALATSLLLAVSPTAIYFSRVLDGSMLVALCGLAMAVGLIQYIDTQRTAALYVTVAALGVGLCAGSSFYALLLLIAAFALALYLVERLSGRKSHWSGVVAAWRVARDEPGLSTRLVLVLLGSFGLTATAFVLYLGGIGHAADLLVSWLRGFLPEGDSQPFIYPLMLLLRYEAVTLFLALVGVGWALVDGRRGARRFATEHHSAIDVPDALLMESGPESDAEQQPGGEDESPTEPSFPFTLFLSYWAFAALVIVTVAGHRPAGNLLLVTVPLALLAGQAVERVAGWMTRRSLWLQASAFAAIALGLTIFLYLQLAQYTQASGVSTVSLAGRSLDDTLVYLILALVTLVLIGGMVLVVWIWRGAETACAGSWLALVVILGLFGFKAAWGTNLLRAADPRELMVLRTTAPDVRDFAEAVEKLSLAKAGDEHTLPITVEAGTGPVVAWYLREFDQQIVLESLASGSGTVGIVTLAVQDAPIGETYRGRGFPLRLRWAPEGLRGSELVQWLLFTEGSQPEVDREVVLWVAGYP